MPDTPWMSAREAADTLEISLPTLYAYVSRGLIRSEPDPVHPRQRRYAAADVRGLLRKRERDPAEISRAALDFGAPVLDSALTLIEDGRFYYRGHDAVGLAASSTLEAVAGLLWTGRLDDSVLDAAPDTVALELALAQDLPPVEALQVALPLAGARDRGAWDPRPEGQIAAGARIVRLMVATLTRDPQPGPIAPALARAWGDKGATDAIGAALILAADHEIAASAFAARVVAGAGATPYPAVQAGLCALQGTRHGGLTARVEALLAEVATRGDAEAVLAERLRRGDPPSGFGHRLYPGGDPRGRELLTRVRAGWPQHTEAHALAAAGQSLLGLAPTLDLGLAALSRAGGFPSHAALSLFALGRMVGWIAHTLEAAPLGLIRPRARYVGVPARRG